MEKKLVLNLKAQQNLIEIQNVKQFFHFLTLTLKSILAEKKTIGVFITLNI